MPNYQFGSSGIVFTDEDFAEKKREIADKWALDDAAKAHSANNERALRKTETYKDRFKFYMLQEDVKVRALRVLKVDAWFSFDFNIKEMWGPFDGKQAVRLIDEAAKNDFDIVGKAVKEGIAIADVRDDGGKTLLHFAAECGLRSVVQTLLKQPDADIDVCDNYRRTPLRLAVEEMRVDIVQHLITEGADVNIKDNDGQTLLDIAEDLFGEAPDNEKSLRDKIKVEIKKEIVRRKENKKP